MEDLNSLLCMHRGTKDKCFYKHPIGQEIFIEKFFSIKIKVCVQTTGDQKGLKPVNVLLTKLCTLADVFVTQRKALYYKDINYLPSHKSRGCLHSGWTIPFKNLCQAQCALVAALLFKVLRGRNVCFSADAS